MDSRMDKYTTNDENTSSRIDKNRRLYDEVSDINVEYIDVKNNTIDFSSLEDNRTRSDYQKQKEIGSVIQPPVAVQEEIDEVSVKKDRIYDINEILKKAKEEQKLEEKKRLINTEYNILTKLDINEIDDKDLKKENIKEIIENVYPKEEIDNNKELFEDMIEIETDIDEEEFTRDVLNQKVEDIIIKDEEKLKETPKIEEDTFMTTTTLMKTKRSKGPIVVLIIFVLLVIVVGAYFLLKYFGTI